MSDDDERSWGSDHGDKLLERMERLAAQDAAGQLIGGVRGDQQRRRAEWTRPDTDTVLAFEAEWEGRRPGHKEEAIRVAFKLPAVRYYQILNAVIDTREALELNPMLVNRLREDREARITARRTLTFRRRRTTR